LLQSHCSSSATIIGHEVNTPVPISVCPTRIVTVSSGAIVSHALISGTNGVSVPGLALDRRRLCGLGRQVKAEDQGTAGSSGRGQKIAAARFNGGSFELRGHGPSLPYACSSAALWIAWRMRG
jgi:hypothetical protein